MMSRAGFGKRSESRWRDIAAQAYLALVLVLGGASAAGFGANLVLQLLGAGLVSWSLYDGAAADWHASPLRRFWVAVALLALVQFLPCPPALWAHLPGRARIGAGFDLIGAARPWLTLSLAPWDSLAALAWWVPALALYCSQRASGTDTRRGMVRVVIIVALASVTLGVAQWGRGVGYIYRITNYGNGPGFFANSNHQSSFLVVALALWGGDLAQRRQAGRWLREGGWGACSGLRFAGILQLAPAGAMVLGVAMNYSLAGLGLLGPVCMALVLIARPDLRSRKVGLVALAAGSVAAFALVLIGPFNNDLTGMGAIPGISRHVFLANGLRMLRDFAPFGSGLGSFPQLYRWYENPALATSVYANHAHDDLLELLSDTGVFGLLAVMAFLVWLMPAAWKLWRSGQTDPLRLAACVAVGVELLHSLVDYPLRTAAMSTLTAMAVAWMAAL